MKVRVQTIERLNNNPKVQKLFNNGDQSYQVRMNREDGQQYEFLNMKPAKTIEVDENPENGCCSSNPFLRGDHTYCYVSTVEEYI